MENQKLSGIERELVLQYLMDGNVPVTITPIASEKAESLNTIHSVDSQIFPVAIMPEKITVEKSGKIYLENPPKNLNTAFDSVRVEFYFNKVGLFFNSKLTTEGDKLVLLLPNEIDRIKDVEEESKYDFSAILYFEYLGKKEINETCVPWNEQELFNRPMWKSIPLENQKEAKTFLESFVAEGKTHKNIGNGLQLIPICNYLTYKDNIKVEAVQDRKKKLQILYVDHERIVFGVDNNSDYKEGTEFGLKLCFSIKNSPIISRDVFVTFVINKIYKNETNNKRCLDCVYTTIQEEDLRFLYEKTTKNLFV